ncbi:glycosyl transferase, family 9 [Afipia carboxidovorans OM5]|uniref:Putative ADP-heptose:LPS heptosyltransferase n=1 Tax=Afipia carboxidovorans (strain ATCC 49405 / DSM 1227 / KCTC 32145 / OM5) TaxID=504832 RepID=B6JGS3_AFIC5|nr:glycosyltransferase family 9 protein [Afipia carboxidovorans]ACI93007.1 glycosyl transferase, family 9 [Afipia carboxidovorans OM5]AEI03262.1 putative ADP-heptose:LPS heptosyltransferase [Afipia carboxidovorans OM4]AEI06839.1 putative ADP-heptose:LPS heptosyltransferase [Afipia carboxidovorans OM5]
MALSTFDRGVWRSTKRLYSLARRVRFAFTRTQRATPETIGQVDRILLIRTDKIGDAIISTAFFKALRDHFPNAQIDIVLGRKNAAAASLLPHLDGVFIARKNLIEQARLIRQLRERNYDVVIDMLTGDSMTAAAYAVLAGARLKIGFDDDGTGLYDVPVPRAREPEHQAVQMLRLIAPLKLMLEPEDIHPAIVFSQSAARAVRERLFPEEKDERKLIVVNLSVDPARYWDDEKFIRLVSDLKSPSVRVVLISAPWDLARLEAIGKASEAEWLPPSADISETVATVSCADLVISPDTSIVHIAAARGKPVVALMPNTTIKEWYPFGVPHRALHCATRVADIPYDEVLAAVRELLAGLDSAQPVPSTDKVVS